MEPKKLLIGECRSKEVPHVSTCDEHLAAVIRWADVQEWAWMLVLGNRSKAFGRNAVIYPVWTRGSEQPGAVLERMRVFYDLVHRVGGDFDSWRACFSLEHVVEPDLASGVFMARKDDEVLFEAVMDYTKRTLYEVLDRFLDELVFTGRSVQIFVDGEELMEICHISKKELTRAGAAYRDTHRTELSLWDRAARR